MNRSTAKAQDSRLRRVATASGGDHVIALTWNGDGKTLAVAAATGAITAFDAAGTATHRLAGHANGTFAIAWLGPMLLSTGHDGQLKWWLDDDELRSVEAGKGWVEHLSVDGNSIATAAGKTVRIFDAGGGLVKDLPAFPKTVSDLAWHVGTLAVACYGQVSLWKPGVEAAVARFPVPTAPLKLAWSRNGQWLAHGNQDASLTLWNIAAQAPLQMSGYTAKVRELSWDSSSRWLATGGGPAVSLWDCSGIGPAGKTPLMLDAHKTPVSAVAYQHRGQLLASADQSGVVCLWQPHNKKGPLIGFDRGTKCECTSLTWTTDDRKLAAGFADGTVAVFKVD